MKHWTDSVFVRTLSCSVGHCLRVWVIFSRTRTELMWHAGYFTLSDRSASAETYVFSLLCLWNRTSHSFCIRNQEQHTWLSRLTNKRASSLLFVHFSAVPTDAYSVNSKRKPSATQHYNSPSSGTNHDTLALLICPTSPIRSQLCESQLWQIGSKFQRQTSGFRPVSFQFAEFQFAEFQL